MMNIKVATAVSWRQAVFMLLAAAVLLLAACGGSSKPEEVAERYVRETYAGNADAVMAMIHLPSEEMDKPGAQELITGKMKAAVAAQKQRADKRGGLDTVKAVEVKPLDQDGKRVSVSLEVTFKDGGEARRDRIKLVETENGWKVAL